MLSIPTFRATCFDRLSICIVQLKCSSINIPRNLVNLTCFILFPSTCIKALLILYFFPFGVNIIKLDFFVFRESLLVWNMPMPCPSCYKDSSYIKSPGWTRFCPGSFLSITVTSDTDISILIVPPIAWPLSHLD